MSTEPNTQRPTCTGCGKEMIYNVPRMGPAGGYVHADSGKLLCAMEISEQSPPPETGAVDVEKLALNIANQLFDGSSPQGPNTIGGAMFLIRETLKPLTQRISELEAENQNHAEHRLIYEARILQLEEENERLKEELVHTRLSQGETALEYESLKKKEDAAMSKKASLRVPCNHLPELVIESESGERICCECWAEAAEKENGRLKEELKNHEKA